MRTTSLTEVDALAAYAILVANAGAAAAADHFDSFVHEFTKEVPTSEWAIPGPLGTGGKFRFPQLLVECNPEDLSPARVAIIARTNKALAALTAPAKVDTH